MIDETELAPETLAAQALHSTEPRYFSITPPVYISSSFERAKDGSYPGGHIYSRDQNPAYDQVEAVLAKLEHGKHALLFASGMAAASAILDSLGERPHLILPNNMYYALSNFAKHLQSQGHARITLVDATRPEQIEQALSQASSDTQLVWVETPSNPLNDVVDVERVAAIAKKHGAVVVADNTTATPVLCNPLDLGVDMVMHSATKYLNGHSDVIAGAVITRDKSELYERVRFQRAHRGAILGSFEAWLLLRGLRTLYLRVRQSNQTALLLAHELAANPAVQSVHYPGLVTHPGHELAKRQMRGGFGGIVSIRVVGGRARAREVLGRLRLFRDATSLGGVESLAEHRSAVEGPSSLVPEDLLRLAIGIEDAHDLLRDLLQALA